jgi:hypothetical protein
MWVFIPIIGRFPLGPIKRGCHRFKQAVLRRKDPQLAAKKEAEYQRHHHDPNDHHFVKLD